MAVLETAGPGPKSSAGPLLENLLLASSIFQILLRLNCYASRLCLAFSYYNKACWDVARTLLFGGCKAKFA